MHRYETIVLSALNRRKGALGLDELIRLSGLQKDNVLWALENLKSNGFAEFKVANAEHVELTEEGRGYADEGLPEERLVMALSKKGAMPVKELRGEEQQIGLSWAKRKGFIEISNGLVKLTANAVKSVAHGTDESRMLKRIKEGMDRDVLQRREVLGSMIKRKLVVLQARNEISSILATKSGIKALLDEKGQEEQIESLDKNLITTRKWIDKSFKPYNIDIAVEKRAVARRHPLRQLMGEIREAYLSMGFQEISSPAIESSFWVFDSLFIPQDHPVRDVQDTFYLENPDTVDLKDVPYVNAVRKAHEQGWHESWSVSDASKAVLRTHMTSASARYVYKAISDIVNKKSIYELPVKRFSIGRMFRNESIDYKHLADFYQTDGIVIGKGLTLANLFDTLTNLYSYLGIKIRFKPSYFPFVEPGVEFQAYSKNTDEWLELGGAGLLREEITGLSRRDIGVLAWGAGVERILLIKDSSLKSISELYNNGEGWLRQRKVL